MTVFLKPSGSQNKTRDGYEKGSCWWRYDRADGKKEVEVTVTTMHCASMKLSKNEFNKRKGKIKDSHL